MVNTLPLSFWQLENERLRMANKTLAHRVPVNLVIIMSLFLLKEKSWVCYFLLVYGKEADNVSFGVD